MRKLLAPFLNPVPYLWFWIIFFQIFSCHIIWLLRIASSTWVDFGFKNPIIESSDKNVFESQTNVSPVWWFCGVSCAWQRRIRHIFISSLCSLEVLNIKEILELERKGCQFSYIGNKLTCRTIFKLFYKPYKINSFIWLSKHVILFI